MAVFNIKSIAYMWYFFAISGVLVYVEFSHLFMKQLGLRARQIGMTNLYGVQHVFTPLLLYIGDGYRVRGLMIWTVSSLLAVSCLLPLLPIFVSLPTCFGTNSRSNSSGIALYCNFGGRCTLVNCPAYPDEIFLVKYICC